MNRRFWLLFAALNCVATSASDDIENAELLVKLKSSRVAIQRVYENCQIVSEYYEELPDGEVDNRETRIFSSGFGCFRIDKDNGQNILVRCANPRKTNFRASREGSSKDFTINSTSESFEDSRDVIFNSARVGNAAYGSMNLDIYGWLLTRSDLEIQDYIETEVEGDRFIEFRYQTKGMDVFARIKFLVEGGIWCLSEHEGPFCIQKNYYVGNFKGVPLVSKVEHSFLDHSQEDGKPFVSYREVAKVLEFKTASPREEYYSLEGLGIEINRASGSFWYWIFAFLIGVAFVSCTALLKTNKSKS